jgi:hypothetical protein
MAEQISQSLQTPSRLLFLHSVFRVLLEVLFAIFLVLTLATPSWRAGVFTWWPLWRSAMLAGRPAQIGFLSVLPGLILLLWLVLRIVATPSRAWNWGRRGITLPLLGLTVLILAGLDPAVNWRTVVQVVGMGLTWLVYLLVVNEKPDLTVALSLVLLIQGCVAVGQFLHQGDLGLVSLGEPSLDATVRGVSVIWAQGQRWLRAYGLTAHPNFLGATLAVLCLMLLQPLSQAQSWSRVGLTLVFSVGLFGLLASFSRASWLAFAIGLMVWMVPTLGKIGAAHRREQGKQERGKIRSWLSNLPLPIVIPLILTAIFLLFWRDLVTSRFLELDTPLEAHSLDERQRDADLALEVIAAHPWLGVGAGNYLPAVRAIEPDSRPVHNVPLLLAAELGLLGAALGLWLMISGLLARREAMGPWLAVLVIGLFDNTLWLTTSWRAAILMALLIAQASRFACRPARILFPWR